MDCPQSLRVGVTTCCRAALRKRLEPEALSVGPEELTILSGRAVRCGVRQSATARAGIVAVLGLRIQSRTRMQRSEGRSEGEIA